MSSRRGEIFTISFYVATDFTAVSITRDDILDLVPKSLPTMQPTIPFISSRVYHQSPTKGEVQLCGMKDATTASFALAASDLEERSPV